MGLEVVRAILTFVFRLFCRIEYHGQENIPHFGPAILVSNHPSYLDPVTIYVGVPRRRLWWMTWDAVFRVPLLGWIIRRFGAFPIDTERSPKEAFETSLSLLRRGQLVGVFPEGGRSYQPMMGEARTGAVRLAVRCGAPVVPVSVAGAYRVWPRTRRLPRVGKISVTYHPPIHFYADRDDRQFYEHDMEHVRQIINEGLRETYLEWHLRRIYDPTLEEFGVRGLGQSA